MNDLPSAADSAARVDHHSFAPVDNGFTVDPETKNDGVPDLQSTDWTVRTLALRDLVRLGRDTPKALLDLLNHANEHVRHVAATAPWKR